MRAAYSLKLGGLQQHARATQHGELSARDNLSAERGPHVQRRPGERDRDASDQAMLGLDLQKDWRNFCPTRWASVAWAICPVSRTLALGRAARWERVGQC